MAWSLMITVSPALALAVLACGIIRNPANATGAVRCMLVMLTIVIPKRLILVKLTGQKMTWQ